jgi:3-hydroxybutyrate dehydrogenase/3-oxoacyl-[acyl-carrier protein] reductase
MGKLDGRVATITSGSTGIGRGIAEAFLAEGAKVVINGRNTEKGENALKELNAGDRGHFIQGDVTVRAEVDRVIDGTVEKFGRIDILVNNAGGLLKTAPVKDLADEDWDYAIRWNLYSAFWASRRALNYMVPQQFGRIINMSSVEGKQATMPAISHYVTAKHALHGFTKAVALEYGRAGVTCNAICPGAVPTGSRPSGDAAAKAAGMTREQFVAHFVDATRTGRLNTPEEVAAVAVLLAGDAGGGITGVLWSVDGGTSPW